MKSEIVFFDGWDNSKKGLVRGLILFPVCFVFLMLWHMMNKNGEQFSTKHWISITLQSVAIVSIIGIHNPNSFKQALFFGMILGYVISNLINLNFLIMRKITVSEMIARDIQGIILFGILSVLLYYLTTKFKFLQYE
jgi:hypothetical protein